ncbi:glycosyltransferase family 39 protein [Clostridium weizhouense]|uniref:Glycosyltransferase family 39 protein n=1 Tax=Clostridium weizhouense TaxID=2859781 RepID=A0ABS7AQY1_9CLOT|nr:glycosyltransferase family 39 protein [Clostridium weizhouense]MBW6411069.1 glycosyltransferase family 39 protein [Clostridium weizhouense]
MFICAKDYASSGTTYMFRDYSYFARFPHMSITVLYFSLIIKIFSNPLVAIRFINIIFSMLNVILIFFISKEIFQDKKKSIWVLLISSVYPPMIIYNNVYCSENMAMPLLLLSILMFFKAMNINNKNKLFFFSMSGLSLSAMHLFRPLGYVMIIAYIMYICIYFKEKIKIKIYTNLLLILTFILPFIIVSNLLISLNITENQLWHAMEPISISILKGTNIESEGAWNEEDASLADIYDKDYEGLDKAAKEIIKERLTTTPVKDLVYFYIFRYSREWCTGDFGSIYWSKIGLSEAYNKDYYLDILGKDEGKILIDLSDDIEIGIQIFYITILILSYVGLYKKKKFKNYKIDFLYIMFCGLSLQCLLTEAQDRYTYPFSWIFILLAITAFDKFYVLSDC